MPWLFLGLSAWLAVLTLNSFHPVKVNRVLFVPSFFFSWLTNELAPFYLAGLVAFGAAFTTFWVSFDQWQTWVSLGLLAFSFLGLVWIYLGGRRAASEVAAIIDEFVAEQRAPGKPRRRAYTRVRNVPFARVAGKTLRLDITSPGEPGERRPAILQIHGGGWVIGDKREQGRPLLRRLATNGWVGFNANYRLSPGATWPDHLVDCKRALAWIREHADEYGVDPNFIAVTGGSAGGHLSSMMALTADDKSLQPGFEDVDLSLQAAVPFYGVYDFTNRNSTQQESMRKYVLEPLVIKAHFDDEPEKFAAASPMDQVNAGAPPFLVIHGSKDTLAPVEDAREFVRLLDEVSDNEVFYVELQGAQHAFDIFSSPRTRRTLIGVQRFLFAVHERYQKAQVRPAAADEPLVVGDPMVEPAASAPDLEPATSD